MNCRYITPILILLFTTASYAQTVQLTWSKDGKRAWFKTANETGNQFFVINTITKKRMPAFDSERFLQAVAGKLDQRKSRKLRNEEQVQEIAFAETANELFVRTRNNNWLLDLKSYEVSKKTFPRRKLRQLFMPQRRSGASRQSTTIRITNSLEQPVTLIWIDQSGDNVTYGELDPGETRDQHTYVGHVWLIQGKLRSGCFAAAADDHVVVDEQLMSNVKQRKTRRTRAPSVLFKSRSPRSPDARWTLSAKEHDLWYWTEDGEKRLTFRGNAENSYANQTMPNVRWAPDSKHFVSIRTTGPTQRTIHRIESSPKDQLQPKLQTQTYTKPGDEIQTETLELFSVADFKRIDISHELISNPWSLRFEGWSKDGSRFYLRYNQRGHQVARFLEVTTDGAVHPIVEEKSDTFIHYSDGGKAVFELLDDDEFLWASERSGWNHLYRYSLKKRELLNEVTSGDWNVKRIFRVDRKTKRVWFYAVGVHEDQDPYHEHFCRVNFDGSDFKVLTRGDGTHSIQFEQDEKYFVDTYSRVDLAPIVALRDSESGGLVAELTAEQTQSKFGPRRLTERFVAKGRDGKTDIWGIIHWPRDFDADKQYPVVENIYAGPHDHHVPKSFRKRYWHQHRIADAGMIVVQIDGMGTAWRSKKFHDVCYKNLRDAGFPDRIAWMKAAAKKFPQMDLSRVGIYGGSAGGQNAMAALLWHNDFYKVAVADCGCHDNRMDKIWWNEQWMGWPVDDSYKQNSNMENAHLLKGDLMLVVGELDKNVDPATTTQVVSKLIKADKDFEFVLVAGAGHGAAETPWASRKRLNFLKEKLNVRSPSTD